MPFGLSERSDFNERIEDDFICQCVCASAIQNQTVGAVRFKKTRRKGKRSQFGTGNISPLNNAALERRLKRALAGDFSDPMFNFAKDFASAETIVIAAPYWDLSFPALLKCYIEQISVIGLTFAYDDAGRPYGLCEADRLIYVTTSGGPMFNEDAGFGYIKSLAQSFYGIQNVSCIKAENLDLIGADAESILRTAEQSVK